MTIINTNEYRMAFSEYLRKGTPIRLATKQTHPTTHYVWRTLGDNKVRSSHQANEGQVFAWNDPPETGHPGEQFNCRCTAEPYLATLTEVFEISLIDVADAGQSWGTIDFVNHYFNANGRAVTVRETGNLSSVVSYYADTLGVHNDLKTQIAADARKNIGSTFDYDFIETYELEPVVFSIGTTTIGGTFSGLCSRRIGYLELQGRINFFLQDEFADPLDIAPITDPVYDGVDFIARETDRYFQGLIDEAIAELMRGLKNAGSGLAAKRISEPGTPYAITDSWSALVSGRFHADRENSIF